ncbi:MAG: hypothetical protein JNJ61_13000, partial [Anaerolineae bacterium]|nr:hypothetical protein [Anaerolineae bacterium]
MLLDELIEPFNTQELVVLLLKCTNDKGRPFLPLAIHKATRLAFSYSKISRIIEKVALQAIEQKRAVLTSRIPESDSQYVFEVDHLPETIEGVIAIPINDSKYIDVAGKSNQMGVLCIIINPPKKLKLSFVAANLNKDS